MKLQLSILPRILWSDADLNYDIRRETATAEDIPNGRQSWVASESPRNIISVISSYTLDFAG
jgi:hypothetical protein